MNVLVTGAAGGIGRALTAQYLAEGATVIAAALDAIPGPATNGVGRFISLAVDVTDPQALASAQSDVAGQVPHLDVVFHCAGMVGRHDRFQDFSTEDFLAVFRVNTVAPILVSRTFLPLLQASAHGRVLALTSRTGALFPPGERPPGAGGGYAYASSKAALIRLIPQLAADLRAAGVTAVGVDPGFVETDMTRGHAGARHQLSPDMCARGLRNVAAALEPSHAGALLRWDGTACRWHAPPETPEDLQLVPPVFPESFSLAPCP